MAKHALFLRWWLMAVSISLGAYFCDSLGVITEIIKNDGSYLCLIMGISFILMSLWCGLKTASFSINVQHDKITDEYLKNIENQEEIGWFTCESFTALGFIGTVIGMIMALKGFASVDVNDQASTQRLISEMAYGMRTAFYTTLVGLTLSRLLMLQYFNISHTRRGLTDE